MNGIHDLGGMHGFGRIEVEQNEPRFHHRWEGRVHAMLGLVLRAGVGNVDKMRHAIERLPPVEYLSAGYYGRWLGALETLVIEHGVVDGEELARRRRALARSDTARGAPLKQASGSLELTPPRATVLRSVDRSSRFDVGQAVRAKNLSPPGHTRLARYVRGKLGAIVTVYPACVFPDSNAHDLGEDPQYVYCVGFASEELWGADAEPGTRVHIDLFEPYLEDAEGKPVHGRRRSPPPSRPPSRSRRARPRLG